MGKYIVKRILQVIPMLFILSLIVFMMVRLIPGDPVDMMLGMDIPKDTKEYERERLGLNDPLYIQYFRFVGNALHGDLGTSIFSGKPVVEELAKRFPKTLTLAVGGTLFGAAVGVLLGIIAAIHRNKFDPVADAAIRYQIALVFDALVGLRSRLSRLAAFGGEALSAELAAGSPLASAYGTDCPPD